MTNTAQEFKVGDKVKYKKGENFAGNGHQKDKEYIVSEVHHFWRGDKHTLIRFKGENIGCYSYRLEHCQSEPQKHIHHDLIVAWAKDPKGCVIQVFDESEQNWIDCSNNHPWWYESNSYRFKPKTKEVQRWKWVVKTIDGKTYFVTDAEYTEEEAKGIFKYFTGIKIPDTAVTAIEEV